MENNKILFFGYLGLLASVMVGIGEFMVHYTPEQSDVPFGYFLSIPESRLTLGHYILRNILFSIMRLGPYTLLFGF